MDLIDYHIHCGSNQSNNILDHFIHQLKIKPISYILQNGFITFQLPQIKFQRYKLFLKIYLDLNNKILKLSYLLLGEDILKIVNQFQKTFLLKKLLYLASNFQTFTFCLHLTSGQLSIQMTFILNSNVLESKDQSFYDLINFLVLQNQQFIQQLFVNILYSFSEAIKHPIYDKSNLKTYILHSNMYTWNLLSGSTSSNVKAEQQYYQLKRKCLHKHHCIIPTPDGDKLNMVYGQIKQPFIFCGLSEYQDMQIKNYFFPNINNLINKKNKLIKQNFSLSKQDIEYIKQNKEVKVHRGREDIEIKIHQFNECDRKRLIREQKILKKIANEEFKGVARYYFPKDEQKKLELFRFTNLTKSKTLSKFLLGNRKTISIFTKLYLMNQIIITLYYIKSNKIVFNNLHYENIFIKSKNIVKIFSFTNSHHQNIQKLNGQYVNNFPYFFQAYNFQNLNHNQDQRSDVSSFSNILYQIIFNKPIFNIKSSNISKLNKKIQFQQIYKFHKIYNEGCQNFGDPILKLIEFLCLRATLLPNSSFAYQIPYMDWMMIIINFIEKYFENRVFTYVKR